MGGRPDARTVDRPNEPCDRQVAIDAGHLDTPSMFLRSPNLPNPSNPPSVTDHISLMQVTAWSSDRKASGAVRLKDVHPHTRYVLPAEHGRAYMRLPEPKLPCATLPDGTPVGFKEAEDFQSGTFELLVQGARARPRPLTYPRVDLRAFARRRAARHVRHCQRKAPRDA